MRPDMHALLRRLNDAREEIDLVRAYQKLVETVWAALTTPARIEEWMGVERLSDVKAALIEGGPFNRRFKNIDLATEGRVLRLNPPRIFEHSCSITLVLGRKLALGSN